MKRCITLAFTLLFSLPVIADMQSDIMDIKHQWAIATYQTPENKQETAFDSLLKSAQTATKNYAVKAEPKIWLAITFSTMADVLGGFGALGNATKAHNLLIEAEGILKKATPHNIESLKGSVYVSLGALYYNVPGWPIGFGDDDKAEAYFQKALATDPNGIDPNYFYGIALLDDGKPRLAIKFFNKALKAPARTARPLADKGRREEVAIKLAKAKDAL